METKSLGFIGGGRITWIFLQAFVNKKAIFDPISVFDTNQETLTALKQKFPFIREAQSVRECAQKDIVFMALPPTEIAEILELIKDSVSSQTILISLAPQITIDRISEKLGVVQQIVRLIPNSTSIINQGYNAACFSARMSEIQKWYVLEMLQLLGHTFETSEEKLEGYCLLSCLLPSYFWFQWHELDAIGSQFGLSQAECRESIYETLNAALNTMYRSGMKPEEVMDLIPVKPIGEHEEQIKAIYKANLTDFYQKIKP
jgi:pyrroline-5-carboxylate reductase